MVLMSVASIVCASGLAAPLGDPLPITVAAGDARGQTCVLWAKDVAVGNVTFTVALDAGFTNIVLTQNVQAASSAVPAKFTATGLVPGTRYFYSALDSVGGSATGTFKTPAALASGTVGFRMGVTGDWRGELAPYPGVRNAADFALDAFVALGDTVYADFPSPAVPLAQCTTLAEFRAKNNEVYSSRFGLNVLADVRSSTLTFATIDDHEVTNDFQGGAPIASDDRFAGQTGPLVNNSEWYRDGLRAFTEFNPIEDLRYATIGDARTDDRPELYRSRTFGRDAAIIMLDARSFRDEGLPAANPLDQNSVIQYLIAAYNPARTMLSFRQLADLLGDLAAAEQNNVTWKFVMVPEPIQNLGVLNASDRFEGYAAERAIILDFIASNGIKNVVFVSADIHGTLVNDLTYQTRPFGPQIPTGAFEITTGSLAFDAPFGPTVAEIAFNLGIPGALPPAVYASLPLATKEAYIAGVINAQIQPLGYSLMGLQGSSIDATLLVGGYTATNTYGWTDFQIDAETQELLVTTYGIDWYTENQLLANPASITGRQPQIVSQFVVRPKRCATDFNRDGFSDFADYTAFVECYEGFECNGGSVDFTQDGFVDFFDYDAFVTALEDGDC
jgi:alkaline phosphatase D